MKEADKWVMQEDDLDKKYQKNVPLNSLVGQVSMKKDDSL